MIQRKLTKCPKYYICDNRDAVYCVVDDSPKKSVYVFNTDDKKLILEIKNVIKVFPGKALNEDIADVYGPKYKGNSVLVETTIGYYIYIGSEIFSFRTKEPVIDYVSIIGNNLVPYPYAKTNNNVYLMLERKIIPNSELKNRIEPYNYYYSLDHNIKKYKEFKVKMIKGRKNSPNSPMYYYIVHPKQIKPDMTIEREVYNYFKKL
jgi:hypothetical protein